MPSFKTSGCCAIAFCLFAGCAAGDASSELTNDTGAIEAADDSEPNPCADGGPCEEPEPLEPDDGGAADDGGPGVEDAATDAGDAGDAKKPDAGGALPTPTCANIDQRLRDDFGIVIGPGTLPFEGLPGQDLGCADRIKVYQMFVRPFEYQRYERLMKPSLTFTMHLYYYAKGSPGSCSGYVPNARAIQFRNLKQCLANVSGPSDPDFNRIAMFLIHESGHILRARNYSVGVDFQKAGLPAKDPSCYDRGFIKTYSLRSTNPVSESLAEAMGLFIVNKKSGSLGTINNFQKECPKTYEWIRANVFNDSP